MILKVLNLYSGLGGNRKLWENVDVTAIEFSKDIAKVYSDNFPADTVVIGDAHQYLLDNYTQFDFIWSSPPCQTHSRMNKATRHKTRRYPDMKLYEEIIFLSHFFKGDWIVENVVPYYGAFLDPHKCGRHLFWSNRLLDLADIKRPPNFINKCNLEGKKELMDWIGIHYDKNIYYGKNHCPAQILRNCVHPKLGKQALNQIMNARQTS